MPVNLDPRTMLVAASVFGLVLTVWAFMVLLVWARKHTRHRELKERLDPARSQSVVARELRLWHEGATETTVVYDEADRRSIPDRMRESLRQAGLDVPLGSAIALLILACAAMGCIGYVFSGRMLTASFGIFTSLALAWWYLGVRTAKRTGTFERQLVDGLELSARALRAGHPLLGSFQLIAEEIPEPVGPMFGEICQQHELGVDMETALRQMTAKSHSSDLRLFAASLSINLRTGGNLADVIEGLAAVVRERIRLQRKFRVLTAQTQISKRILTGMPILMFFVLNVLNPEYMEPLYSTQRGNLMLATAAGMLWSGWWVMNKMAVVAR